MNTREALKTLKDFVESGSRAESIIDEALAEPESIERTWISVEDKLPEESGWYLVFAPTYSGGSSSGLDMHEGIMFSNLKVTKDGKKSWSIETGYHKRPNCVMYWMPLPIPTEFGHFEEMRKDGWLRVKNWVDNETGEKRCLP